MRVLQRDPKTGEIKVRVENADDLWHLHNLVLSGDSVRASTYRREEVKTDKVRPERGEKVRVTLTIRVEGGKTPEECRKVAYAIAHSALVNTAFFASDPNLGRILAAVGYAGIDDLDQTKIDLYLGCTSSRQSAPRAMGKCSRPGTPGPSFSTTSSRSSG